MIRYCLFSLAFISTELLAADSKPAPIDPLAAATLWRVFGSLGAILLGIFALVWLLRRSGALTRGRGGKMQVVDVLSLGQRERLVLVAVGDQQIVLGVAPGRVQAVHTIDSPYVADTVAVGGKFADALKRVQSGAAEEERRHD